jgi:hypothetical protein
MQISDVHALALSMLNSDLSDYDSTKLMTYTNAGIGYVQNLRIEGKDPLVKTQLTITGTISRPSDFFGFLPPSSAYPLIATGTNISLAPGAPPSVDFFYSQMAARVSNVTDAFPLPDEYSDFVAYYISIRLQSDNSMDVTQDLSILANDVNAFIKAKGG